MKVVHLIVGLNNGGAEAALLRLVSSLESCDHSVISLTSEGLYGPQLRGLNVPVFALGLKKNNLISFLNIFRLPFLLKTLAPDVIQSWMYHANFLASLFCLLSPIPVCWGLHNTSLTLFRSSFSTILLSRLCSILSYVSPKHIIACAQSSVKAHLRLGYCPLKFRVIHNGYDSNYFRPIVADSTPAITSTTSSLTYFTVGMLARFDPYKDHLNLLRAIQIASSKIPNLRVLLAGPDVVSTNLFFSRHLAALSLLGIVKVLGPCSNVPEFMNSIDVHVLSSSAEAFPNVLAEAMLCGTPCVTTNVGDASLIVSEHGWLVPPSNPAALAESIIASYFDSLHSAPWSMLKHNCRTHILEKFSLQKMSSSYFEIWQSLL